MNRTAIDWPGLDYTWNPLMGCKHNCHYCYAKKMNDRFKWIPEWTEPVFFPERLEEPYKKKKPLKIFVGSMCDLFGEWVDIEWIDKVLIVARENPQHTFMFLTKNPVGYQGLSFPDNCQLGLTLTGTESAKNNMLDTFYFGNMGTYHFASIEPLLGSFKGVDLFIFDLVIVGKMTGQGAIKPKKDWIESIKHPNIYYKNNIKPIL